MARGNQQLGFAIRAVNEASKALKEISGDLGHTGKAAADADPKLARAGKSTRDIGDAAAHAHGPLGKFGGALGDVSKIAGGFIIAQGLMKLPGFLTSSAQGAAEDAAATDRLNQTLENLISRGAAAGLTLYDLQQNMNLAIKQGQGLAFSDDQVRDSMQFLLNATDDYGEALKRHRAAMDLARGANIDLGLATKLLGKINEENVNTFKKLGIELPKTATEAEALAAVQKRFGGQADAYAKSTAGQFEQLKIRMSEVKETIGAALLPVMTALGNVLVEKIAPAVERLAALIGPALASAWTAVGEPLVDLGRAFIDIAWPAVEAAWRAIEAAGLAFSSDALDLLIKLGELGWPVVADAWARISDQATLVANAAWAEMQAAWEVIQPLLEKAAAYTWGALTDLAGASWAAMKDALALAVEQLNRIPAGKIRDEARDTSNWADAWNKTKAALQPVYDILQPLVRDLLVSLKANVIDTGAALADLGKAFKDLWDAIQPLHPLLKLVAEAMAVIFVGAVASLLVNLRLLADIVTTVVIGAIKSLEASIREIALALEFVTKAVTEWGPALVTGIADVVGKFTGLANDIAAIGGGIISNMYDIGENIVRGLWNGVRSLWDSFTDWLREQLNKLPAIIKKFYKIGSPSKLMYDIGQDITQGFWNGLDEGLNKVITFWDDKVGKWVSESVAPLALVATTAAAAAFTAFPTGAPGAAGGFNFDSPAPPFIGSSTIPHPGNLVNQYIGGGQFGLVPQFGIPSIDKYGSSFVAGAGSQSYDPSLPNYVPSAIDTRIPAYIAGFAHGSDFIPSDGLAYLHRGEAVVPAAENRRGEPQSFVINLMLDGEVIQRQVVKVIDGQLTTEAMQYGVRVD